MEKKLVYHCLLNAYRNASIEVCAPPTNIPKCNTFLKSIVKFLQTYYYDNLLSYILLIL